MNPVDKGKMQIGLLIISPFVLATILHLLRLL